MTYRMKRQDDQLLENIIVVVLENSRNIDPVSLAIYGKKAIEESGGDTNTKVAFVLKREGDERSQSFHYLKIMEGHVSERYLFNPVHLVHFKKKKQCEDLWHGCMVPSMNQIIHHAKILKLQDK